MLDRSVLLFTPGFGLRVPLHELSSRWADYCRRHKGACLLDSSSSSYYEPEQIQTTVRNPALAVTRTRRLLSGMLRSRPVAQVACKHISSRRKSCCEATVTSLTGHEGTVQAAWIMPVRARHWLTASVFCLQTLSFSGNGYYLASGSDDGVVKCGSWHSLPAGQHSRRGLSCRLWDLRKPLNIQTLKDCRPKTS